MSFEKNENLLKFFFYSVTQSMNHWYDMSLGKNVRFEWEISFRSSISENSVKLSNEL